MRHCRIARCLLYPALLLAAGPGCQAFARPRPVAILAKDADTGQPIPGAEVRLSYPDTSSPLKPTEASAATGADGIARLRATRSGDMGASVYVAAKGYMQEERYLSAKEIEALQPAGWFEADGSRPVTLAVALYGGARPSVELVVPTGYRGLIKATVLPQEEIPCPPGQRRFSYVVPPSGAVEVKGPALLKRIDSPDFQARYADGTPLSREATGEEVGLWCLSSSPNNSYTFLVGTKAEYTLHRAAGDDGRDGGEKKDQGRRQGGGGGRGGRGGGGRRGGGGQQPF
jgi:hypothetical protein